MVSLNIIKVSNFYVRSIMDPLKITFSVDEEPNERLELMVLSEEQAQIIEAFRGILETQGIDITGLASAAVIAAGVGFTLDEIEQSIEMLSEPQHKEDMKLSYRAQNKAAPKWARR